MNGRAKIWLACAAAAAGVAVVSLIVAGWFLSRRIEPFVRERAVARLERRFDGEVTLGRLDVSMPDRNPLRVLLGKGRGARLVVQASSIQLRRRGVRTGDPLLKIESLTFDLDGPRLFDSPAVIDLVRIEGMTLVLPPKDGRRFASPGGVAPRPPPGGSTAPQVIIRRIIADGTTLLVLPRDPSFAKDGAGAQFDIAVTGPASSPKFGLDRKKGAAKQPSVPRLF